MKRIGDSTLAYLVTVLVLAALGLAAGTNLVLHLTNV